jgi:large subunit ribosomal protein L23
MKHASHILIDPRITEKGAYLSEKGVYVFNVAKNSNKKEIADAIKAIFKVTPIRVRVTAVPRKQVFTRGTNRWGKTAGGKKAYVYLKKGETIELV